MLFFISCISILPQGFNLPSKEVRIFNLKDSGGRNQATFFSEAHDTFSKAYDKYFTGKHSDEIYQEVKFGK